MAVMDSIDFNYNGEYSSVYGILNISVSSGMYEESFAPSRDIKEQSVRGSKYYFQEIQYKPLELKLSFAFKDGWNDDEQIRSVARWLIQDYYKPLFFAENPDRIYYAIVSDEPRLVHNGMKQGYITLNMRCNSPYTYSPVQLSSLYDLSANVGGGTLINLTNNGDVKIKPEISITKVGNGGDIRIVNLTDGGIETKLSGVSGTNKIAFIGNVADTETVTIGADIYEFDNGSGVTAGRISVLLGTAIATPTVAPTLSVTTNTGSALAAGTYFVKYTWVNVFGETLVSPEASIAVSTGQQLTITTPNLPAGVSGINIFMSTTTNTETFQASSVIKTFTKGTAMVLGRTVPTANTTVDLSPSNAINKLTNIINTSTTKVETITAISSSNSVIVTGTSSGSLTTTTTCVNGVWQYSSISSSGLIDQENIYIDGERKTIKTSLSNVYRYANFNNNYLELLVGVNGLRVYGNCKIQFRYQNKTLQG